MLVTGGTFPYGITDSEVAFLLADYTGYTAQRYAQERPQRPVTVRPFHIDVFPVTNSRYAEAIARGVVFPPPTWGLRGPDAAPAVGMSWYEAARYAECRGGRLPSEEEWEMAAGWDAAARRKRRYPWGDEWDRDRSLNAERLIGDRIVGCGDWVARFWRDGAVLDSGVPLVPVGAIEGDLSPCGARMMSGHVWEWTAPASCEARHVFVRGGSWIDDRNSSRVTYRVATPKAMWKFGLTDIGFRCVYDVR